MVGDVGNLEPFAESQSEVNVGPTINGASGGGTDQGCGTDRGIRSCMGDESIEQLAPAAFREHDSTLEGRWQARSGGQHGGVAANILLCLKYA